MKNSFIILLSIISFSALAQTRQNINKNTGTVSNVLTTIDSIRFNGSSTTMEVVLQNGTVESHSISDIQNVNFISASQHSCGAANVHNPNLNYGSMTDQEGNIYKTIVIGTQEWMAENLKTSIYRNGDPIATNLSDAEWGNTLITQLGAWAFYNNDIQYECPYGKLYNWYAVADPRHVCPAGWHEPTGPELNTLTDYLWGVSIAGAKMKTTSYWAGFNFNTTNVSGFSALPGGLRNYNGNYAGFPGQGYWWTSGSDSISGQLAYNSLWIAYDFNSAFDSQGPAQHGKSVRCLKDESNTGSTLPVVSTSSIANTTLNSAYGGGNVTSDGGTPVTQRGVCWSTFPNPTTLNNITIDGSGVGCFRSNITDLTSNTTYYVRAYAINGIGTSYGNQKSFSNTNSGNGIESNPGEGITYNGYTYSTVALGNGQEWMSENLKTSSYRNGDLIPTGLSSNAWQLEVFGIYINNDIYGNLYNWYAIADPRHVCPSGWHEPTDCEWYSLTDYLGGEAIAGGKMKTMGLQYWNSPNQDATNESGFSGLPGGIYVNPIYGIGRNGSWWSTSDEAWYRNIYFNDGIATRSIGDKHYGFSVRCLKD